MNILSKMNLKLTVSVIAVFAMISFGFTADTTTPEKITICHIPPGNPGNCHEITISVKALQTHIDHHGDALVCYNSDQLSYYTAIAAATGLPLNIGFSQVDAGAGQ